MSILLTSKAEKIAFRELVKSATLCEIISQQISLIYCNNTMTASNEHKRTVFARCTI